MCIEIILRLDASCEIIRFAWGLGDPQVMGHQRKVGISHSYGSHVSECSNVLR